MDNNILSIDKIGLSKRTSNALHRAGIHTYGELLNVSLDKLQNTNNLGEKSISEIESIINKGIDNTYINPKQQKLFSLDGKEFALWVKENSNKELVLAWLKEKRIQLDALELLSTKSYNILMFAGYKFLYEIAFLSPNKLMEIHRMDAVSADEIEKNIARYLEEQKHNIFSFISENQSGNELQMDYDICDIIKIPEHYNVVLTYVKTNDIQIECSPLSNRPKNRLIANGYSNLSDIIFMTEIELMKIPSMGTGSVKEVLSFIDGYLSDNEKRILAVINGDESAIWSDESIAEMILDLYQEREFRGLSFAEITEELNLPEQITSGRLKQVIGNMIANNQLEYVEYRCYRVYRKFEAVAKECTDIDDRSREFIERRLNGDTLKSIGEDNGISRERVRQIVAKAVEKVKNYNAIKTGTMLFDEDYYRYFYSNYKIDKNEISAWLGIPESVWRYLALIDVQEGSKDLQSALEDSKGMSIGLRLKIRNYLNRNRIFVNDMWVDKKRSALEEVVVRKYCQEDVVFCDFPKMYNSFLESEGIEYDDSIYYTDDVYRTRKNHLANANYLLWKQNEKLRYYDVNGQDYTELLNTLNLESYENIEISTLKFMREYPNVMRKYDIRDQYELHNLLKKIIPNGSYNNILFGRNPTLKFGNFDRDSAILNLLIDNAPISSNDLAELVSSEYGYDVDVIKGTYFQCIAQYSHNGMFDVDQKQMSDDNKRVLKRELTEDFYYIDEIRRIYSKVIPNANTDEINPYNLKSMGFLVLSNYVLQNHSSLDKYFEDLLTTQDFVDVTPYRKQFVYVSKFSMKLIELKRSLEVIEFEPNKLINFRKIEQSGVSKGDVQDFCDDVYDFVEEGSYFSAESLVKSGFDSPLYELGFDNWFYANLLLSDDRFSYGTMFGNLIMYKGTQNITTKTFLMNRVKEYGCIDTFDLMTELTNEFGCTVKDKWDMLEKLRGTEIYHDKILDRLYANEDLFYSDTEGGFCL